MGCCRGYHVVDACRDVKNNLSVVGVRRGYQLCRGRVSWDALTKHVVEACRGDTSWGTSVVEGCRGVCRGVQGTSLKPRCRGRVSWSMSWSTGYKFEAKVSWKGVVEHVVERRVQV